MGFKCPICREDFEYNKEKMIEHLEKSHYGTGKVIYNAVLNICEGKKNITENKEKENG